MTVRFLGVRERQDGDGFNYLYEVNASQSIDGQSDMEAWFEQWKELRRQQRIGLELADSVWRWTTLG